MSLLVEIFAEPIETEQGVYDLVLPEEEAKCGGEGGKPGPCPEGNPDKPSGRRGEAAAGAIHQEAEAKSRTLVDRIKDLPRAVYNKAKDKVTSTYTKLEGKYGKGMALAIMGAGIVGTATPLPGGGVIAAAPLLASAELYRRYRGTKSAATHRLYAAGTKAEQMADLSEEEIRQLGEEFMDLLLSEWQQETKSQTDRLAVPDYRQQSGYDCGAAASHSVASYHGVGPEKQEDFIRALGTNAQEGTSPEAIIKCMKSLGLGCLAKADMSVEDLEMHTDQGEPVICCVQAYGTAKEEAQGEAGHYVVVCGVGDDSIALQDPSAGPVEMPHDEFVSKWYDKTSEGQELKCYGMAVGKAGTKVCFSSTDKVCPSDDTLSSMDKGLRIKAMKQKPPAEMAQALHRFFIQQAKVVLSKGKGKKALPNDWLDVEHWTKQMYEVMRPIVSIYYDFAANQTVSRLGGSPSLFHVVAPKLKQGVDKATLLFCEQTNETTSQELTTALAQLREELTEGLEAGDVKNAMMRRVQTVFERATNERAFSIAVTEASRGQHAAQEIVAQESGVVKGKRWLLSADACPQCLPLSNKVVGLGENFAVNGTGPYAAVPYPPFHPQCRCTWLEVLE